MMNNFPLYLAPMAGFTDGAFRLLCRAHGADCTVTEMVSAQAMVYRDKKTAVLAAIPAGDDACAVQLFGHDPVVMGEAAAMIASGDFTGCSYAHLPIAIDLNMGCPVRKIVTGGDGSALMRDPALCGKIVAAAVRSAQPYGVPVTVKIRAGWDHEHRNAVEVAQACGENGAAAVTVHGRTRTQMYAPASDNGIIRAVRLALPAEIPVIGNGDVDSPDAAFAMVEETGCDGVMIGRAALGNPWLFAEIKARRTGKPFTPPTEEMRRSAALALVRAIVADKGEERGVREARGRAAHFIRGIRGSARMREQLNRAATLQDVKAILEESRGPF